MGQDPGHKVRPKTFDVLTASFLDLPHSPGLEDLTIVPGAMPGRFVDFILYGNDALGDSGHMVEDEL